VLIASAELDDQPAHSENRLQPAPQHETPKSPSPQRKLGSILTFARPAKTRMRDGPSPHSQYGPHAIARYPAPMRESLDFELHGDHVELNQLLKLAGLCDSGGAGKQLVASGAVQVDGVVELRKTCKIRAGQVVRVGEAGIVVRAPG
jgi:ribosome-associated protein